MIAAFFAGGRKWRGFLVLVLLVAILVIGGWIKSESVIRDLVLGLFAVLGAATASEKFAPGGKPKEVSDGK